MMKFFVKFAFIHETFCKPEIEAVAEIEGLELTIIEHNQDSPFCVIELPSIECAKRLAQRSILVQSIHELWGEGESLEQLHQNVKETSSERWPLYRDSSFKFEVEPFRGSRSNPARLALIQSFGYLPLDGPIRMSKPDEIFGIFEHWPHNSVNLKIESPNKIFFARFITNSYRDVVHRYDLKKRGYISTTSMDSELSLITANMVLAAPGKLIYDPFVGTGSFPIACAHYGAVTWGSDIDGLSMRGQGGKKSLAGNFEQYKFPHRLGGAFAADLTNTPLRKARIWDGIVCDPPYGVREGLKVLGARNPEQVNEWSKANYKTDKYVPPKRPYGFLTMLDDLLVFASESLVDDGRLCFWMPTANSDDQKIDIPEHPCLEIVSVSVQQFYKWSRRLITYRRLPDQAVSKEALEAYNARQIDKSVEGKSVNELNPFRKGYFSKFQTEN